MCVCIFYVCILFGMLWVGAINEMECSFFVVLWREVLVVCTVFIQYLLCVLFTTVLCGRCNLFLLVIVEAFFLWWWFREISVTSVCFSFFSFFFS